MKSKRHNRILEIINKKEIETQEELAEELKKSGFEVTQATISRDIKILKLLKVQSISGKYRYVAPTKEERNINDKLFSILANSAISVEKVDKFVVVKTLTGAASAAAEAIDSLYIADGHHRAKSAVEVGLKRRKKNPSYTGDEEFNYFLSIVYPDNELEVLDYNRTVKDLNGLSKEEFLNAIEKGFKIKFSESPVKPIRKHTFGMYMDNTWYELEAKRGTFNEKDPMDRLDVSILQNNLLSPILGIDDPTKSDRIEFIGGIRGIKELEKRANKDMKVSFSMFATTIDDIMSIADCGMIMPPKSTWFEPKPRSGLFIHKLS